MPKYCQMSVLLVMLICLNINIAHAESRISRREKQIRIQESALNKTDKEITENISETSGLNDYIRIGLERNPGLRASFYEWKSALRKVPQAFSLPDPQLTYTDYLESVETRVGPQKQAFSINQRFPLPDKLWIRKSKAFKASEAAYYKFERQRLDLTFQIVDAYYEYAYLSKAILLTKENMKLLSNFESVAQIRYTSGMQKNQDLLKVQVELSKLENNLYSLEDLRIPLTARLNTLLNFPKENVLPWPKDSLEDTVLGDEYRDVNALVESFKESNPKLRALSEKVEENKEILKLSKREFFPDLTVGVTRIDTADALNSSINDSGKDAVMVMFSVNVPIWFHRLNAGVQDARASLKAAENQRLNMENELLSRLALVHYKLRDALRQSHLYKDALVPKAGQTLNAVQSGYEAGNVEFLSLIDAQRVLLDFQLAYYRHSADFYQRFFELKSLLGEASIDTQEEF